jgi:hypothetical protein
MSTRKAAAAAGLAYVVGAAIENQELFEAPGSGASADEIRVHYFDQALAVVTTVAGALALVAFAVLAVALFRLLRASGAQGPWLKAGLAGGLAGPALAAVALVATAIIAVDPSGISDDGIRTHYDFAVDVRTWGAPLFAAMFLVGYGISALRSGAWTELLARAAIAIGVLILIAPLVAVGESELGSAIGFGLQAVWIAALSLWLAFGGSPAADFVRRSAFLILSLAAGAIGLALLAVPEATGTFFAWGLFPQALAAFAGGVYVGSAALYAIAIPEGAHATRGLVAGAAMLSVSVLIVTLVHLEEFDLDRGQAWAWLVLFAGFSIVTVWLLVSGRGPGTGGGDLEHSDRSLLGVAATTLGALALVLWLDPEVNFMPYLVPELGGRFAGSWAATLAVIAGWAAFSGDRAQGRLAGLGLALLPGGVFIGGLRTLGELEPYPSAVLYMGALLALTSLGVSIALSAGKSRT